MKQKYKSGDLLTDVDGCIIEVLGHSTAGHCYLCNGDWTEYAWVDGYIVDDFEKIGTL